MTKKRVGGYAFRVEIQRARIANRCTREALRRLIDEKPGPQTMALLVAKAATSLAENMDALDEIEQIAMEGHEEDKG